MRAPEKTGGSVGYRLIGGGVSTVLTDLREGEEIVGTDKHTGRTVLVRWTGLLWEETNGAE